MKKILFIIFILLAAAMFLTMLFVPGAQAGRPRPTAYPPPGGFEAAAYPPPEPSWPFAGNPPPDKPYVWGVYNLDGNWRWYVTKFTPAPDIDANIWLCTAQDNPYYQTCYRHRHDPNNESMEYNSYEDGMSVYRSVPITACGYWGAVPDTSSWDGQLFELHQPNWYLIPCVSWDYPIYLPFVRKP